MVSMAFSLGGKRRPFTASPNYAVGLPNGAAVTDSRGTAWRTTGGNQVSVNGVTDTTTSGVTRVILISGKIWQLVPSGWYSKTFPSDPWAFLAGGPVSASMATINVGDVTSALVDSRGYVWMLTAGGVIVVDGTADSVTHDVSQLVYYADKIWQNTIFGWYNKTLPTDAWASSGAPGAATSGNRLALLGAQLGDPGPGDPTLFNQFHLAMNEGPGAFTTYAVPDPCVRDGNNQCIGAADWNNLQVWQDVANYSAHGINILNGYAGSAATIVPVVGVSMAQFGNQFGITSANEFTAIQNGSWDNRLDAIYQAYIDHGFTYIISRPGWEMNGDWEPWSVFPNNSNAAAFAATFRHISTHAYNFAAAKGITIEMCWNPGYVADAQSTPRPDYTLFYPGDAYVDHIGIDTYGACSLVGVNGPQLTFPNNNYFGLDDAIKMCIAKNKPLCFPEIGVGQGEHVFQENVQARMLQSPNCKVSFVSIWDQPTGCGDDRGISAQWSVDAPNGPASTAWRNMFNSIRNNNARW